MARSSYSVRDECTSYDQFNERLCMATIPEDMFIEAVNALVKAEEDWVPSEPETSLYIRPFAFACESSLGVHKSKHISS